MNKCLGLWTVAKRPENYNKNRYKDMYACKYIISYFTLSYLNISQIEASNKSRHQYRNKILKLTKLQNIQVNVKLFSNVSNACQCYLNLIMKYNFEKKILIFDF